MIAAKRIVQTSVIVLGLGLVAPVVHFPNSVAFAQKFRYEGARQVINRTQEDLTRGTKFLGRNHKEAERLRNAQKHLSELDRHLAKGKFDKDKLDSAIGDIQSVLDHNVLQGQDRDMLMQDVSDLRAIREQRG